MDESIPIAPVSDKEPSAIHERGKRKRRRAILDAACDIISEAGEAGMTMRAMAARAGVSPATPYNLFGSKQAILQAIYAEDFDNFRSFFDERASHDPLVRIFDLVDVSIAYLQLRPDFYQALFGILQHSPEPEMGSGVWAPRASYLNGLLGDCVAAGYLPGGTPLELLGTTMVRIFRAIAQEWVENAITLDEQRRQLGLTLGLILGSLLTDKASASMAELRRRYE